MKDSTFILLLLLSFLVSSCTEMRAKWAANEYCNCDKEEDLMERLDCKENILDEHRVDMLNKQYEDAFWNKVCEPR